MMQFPKTTVLPFTQLELCNHGLKSMKVNAIEMGSVAMIYIPSFINIGSGIQNLTPTA
jgi:hypothetical protein